MNAPEAGVPVAFGADKLAELALALEAKVAAMPEHLDPARRQNPASSWSRLVDVDDPLVRRRLTARLFLTRVAAWPSLNRLADPVSRLVLLPREALVAQLCALALARRPGAIRCLVDRVARIPFEDVLGTAFERLQSIAAQGSVMPEPVTRWTPMHWACVGYFDWVRLMQRNDQPLRRIVRMSLPPGLLAMQRKQRIARADVSAPQALQRLAELGVPWPC